MRFTKAHGAGNDFVVLPDLDDRLELPDALVRALCDRRRGVGGDGVLRLGAPPAGADVFMDYRNADGGAVEMCGNGVRVTAKHLVDHGVVDAGTTVVRVATRAGLKEVRVERGADGRLVAASVDMGRPVLDPALVPYEVDEEAGADDAEHELVVDGSLVRFGVVSMGNPHAVIEVDDVSVAPVATLGPQLEHQPRFPRRVNVGFAEVVDAANLRLRVWERGVGETAACGTGACAAVVSLQRRGRVGEEVDVHLPGGVLRVHHAPGGTVRLAGGAVEVGHGELDAAWLTTATREGVPL